MNFFSKFLNEVFFEATVPDGPKEFLWHINKKATSIEYSLWKGSTLFSAFIRSN